MFKTSEPLAAAFKSKPENLQHHFSDLLPYFGFDETNNLFYNKKSTGFIFETAPLMGSSEDIERRLTGLFQHTLPKGSNLQFLLIASPRIGNILSNWSAPRDHHPNPVFQQMAVKRKIFLTEKTKANADSSFCLRHFRLIISYSLPGHHLGPMQINEFLSIKKQVVNTFKNFGLPTTTWTAETLVNGLDELLNLGPRSDYPKTPWNPLQSLSEQMLSPSTHFLINKQELLQESGQYAIRLYETRTMPREWCLSEMTRFIGDPINELMQISMPFALHYGVHISDDPLLEARLMGKSAAVEKSAAAMGKWFPSLHKEVEEWGLLRKKLEGGQRLLKTQMKVILFGEAAGIDQAEQQVLDLFRSSTWELAKESLTCLPSFIACLPCAWGEGAFKDQDFFKKTKTTLSHEPTNLLPIQGEWQGTQSPGLILSGRRGQILYWDPFDNAGGNYNTCVVGKSGSGKSVFMQEMVASFLGRGGRVFVLDVGRSFEKTARLLGGQFIEFSTQSPLCINPFSNIPKNDPKETADALAMLKSVVALMAAPKQGTSDLENSLIEKAIFECWAKKGNLACIDDIANHLLEEPKEQVAINLGKMLYPYTSEGSFGRFFYGQANIDFNSPLVILELEELKERKDLQAVIIHMMVIRITNAIYLGDRLTPCTIVFDEANDMFQNPQSANFVETAARRLRKYYGGLVIGVQGVDDLYASPGAKAVFENSDWLALLSVRSESIDQLKTSKRISMDMIKERMMRSLHTRTDDYAEIMINGPQGYAVTRLYLDPFSSVLYSSKAQEYSYIQQALKSGMSLVEAIESLVERKQKNAET